jgi:LPS-assembly protein
VLIVSTRAFYLYGKSSVKYNTIDLDASVIAYDGANQSVKAYGGTDTAKNSFSKAQMKDGTNTTYADTLSYNFKTQKGRTVNSYYTEGELFVNAQVLKKSR